MSLIEKIPRPIVIVGPTAGGKSELAVRLAEMLPGGGEVISADSMQIYRHMNVGTAKPSAGLRARAVHHMIDVAEPTERFTVADWLKQVEPLMTGLPERGIRPIIVGGTNLYIKALLEGMFELDNAPGMDRGFRDSLAPVAAPELHERLQRVDPQAGQRIHRNDHKRIVRALEVFHLTGKPISSQQTQWDSQEFAANRQTGDSPGVYRFNPILIGIEWPTELLNPRINLRVKAMFHPESVSPELAADACPRGQNLLEETRDLEGRGLLGEQARQALGYKQVLAHLTGEMSLEEAFEQTKILTRRYAKTQRTWLKRYRAVHWLPAGIAGEAGPDLHAAAAAIVSGYST